MFLFQLLGNSWNVTSITASLKLSLVSVLLSASCVWSEDLVGTPAFPGQDFPRIVSGHTVTEAAYSVFFRSCLVSLYIMEKPIEDENHLRLSLQLEYFILGARHVGAVDARMDAFINEVKKQCTENGGFTLAQGVASATLRFTNYAE